MDILAIYVLKALILPPTLNLLAIATALVMRQRLPRFSRLLLGVAFWSMMLLAIPIVGTQLARPLQSFAAFDPSKGAQGATAIVILGGGRYVEAPEYDDRDTVHQRVLSRLRYGAQLAAYLHLPVGLIGGDVNGGTHTPESVLMLEVMGGAFKTPVKWIETSSRNTAENAVYAHQLISEQRIILVTNAMHMARAREMFERAGFTVVPAPVEFSVYPSAGASVFDYIPCVDGLAESESALHEYLGILWYRLRYSAADLAELANNYGVTDVGAP